MAKKKKVAKKPVKKAAKKPAKAAKKAPAKKQSTKPARSVVQMPPEGTVVWMGLNTPDQASAARFYRQVLKLSSKLVPMGEQSMMILSAGGNDVAHVSEMTEGGGPRWMAFFYVKDVDAAAAEAAKAGGKIQVPPTNIEEGCFCVMLDPQGVEFAVFKPS